MMYIFEGIDGAGKDTLINKIAAHKKLPVFNGFNVYDNTEFSNIHQFVQNKEEWQKAIGFEIVNFCKQTNVNVLVNRFTWSELVYSKVLRKMGYNEWYSDIIEKELNGIAKIIYVDVRADEAKRRLEKSGKKKSQLVLDNLDNMREEYLKLIKLTKLPVAFINSMYVWNDKSYMNDDKDLEEIAVGITLFNNYSYGTV